MRRDSSPLCVASFRALFPSPPSVTRTPGSPSSFFFRLVATRSPTGLLPGPTVDPDAPTSLYGRQHTCGRARSRPDFQEEERRRRPLTIRLRAPLIPEWIREEQDSRWRRRREKELPRKCSCRESASNLLYLDWQELWQWKNALLGVKTTPSMKIKYLRAFSKNNNYKKRWYYIIKFGNNDFNIYKESQISENTKF